jgi:hypothetical protein
VNNSEETGNMGNTGNIGYPRRRKQKQKQNTICGGHHNAQINTNNVLNERNNLIRNWYEEVVGCI